MKEGVLFFDPFFENEQVKAVMSEQDGCFLRFLHKFN